MERKKMPVKIYWGYELCSGNTGLHIKQEFFVQGLKCILKEEHSYTCRFNCANHHWLWFEKKDPSVLGQTSDWNLAVYLSYFVFADTIIVIISNKRYICENHHGSKSYYWWVLFCFFISSNKKCVCVNYNSVAVNHTTGALPYFITMNSQLIY